MPRAPIRHIAFTVAAFVSAAPASGMEPRDLYLGEALYHANQQHYFEALERLDSEIVQYHRVDEPELDSLHHQIGYAKFSVGDFELSYRMHHRAGRAIQAVLEADVPEPVRNEAAYRLARIHFQKDQPHAALLALDRIDGEIPEDIRDEIQFLRANLYMAIGRPADAVDVLRTPQASKNLRGFWTYNLGIALLQDGRRRHAIQQLDRAGTVRGVDQETLAIRDKSNLVLGTLLFESSEFGPAQRSLDRVRLQGPFSNQALLRAGWAAASSERFEKAVVPWNILAQREATDAAVQEALLALPYAYSRLSLHGRAAVLYGRAVGTFDEELSKLDHSIRSIREGDFLEALVREEIRQNEDWVIRLRELPDAPETFYLMELMASHDFQSGLQNYLDLEDMRKKLIAWQRSLDSFEDIVQLRKQYYEPLLPEVDRRFRKLDAQLRLRLEQRKHVEQRLQQMLIAPRPDYLLTADERLLEAQIEQLEAGSKTAGDFGAAALKARIDRLKGVLLWNVETQYPARLTRAHVHLRELNADIDRLKAQYDSFVRTRQAAVHGYVGHAEPIEDLRGRVAEALERLEFLMAQQGQMLEVVASRELLARRKRLEAYLNQARFAFADSYDRAAKAQAQ
jgi:hypothetical protein